MKYFKKHIALIAGLLLSTLVYSQKEAYNWFFGQNVGLTWNTTQSLTCIGLAGTPNAILEGLPTFVTGSQIVTQEGCFSLSDENGNLLFYSHGRTIWNKNHAVMENGTDLLGHDSSAQSGIIMPYPGQSGKFIAICININWQNQLSYSVIDMSLNGGLGGVVEKNVMLTGGPGGIGESVSAIRHSNGRDFWITAPGRGTTTYMNAWLVTSSGVETSTPVISVSPIAVNHGSAAGYLKFTPDGKHFAWPSHGTTQLLYGEFDASQGRFFNIKQIAVASYGVEFSNSGKYMFAQDHANILYVYDFEKLITANTESVKTINWSSSYALQMGPDGRIYGCAYQQNYLYVIDNPEEFENLRAYQLPAGFLPGNARCRIGFPSFSASWFGAEGDETVCIGTPCSYSMSMGGITNASYVVWNFGDGTEIQEPLPSGTTSITKEHSFKSARSYMITISIYDVNNVLIEESVLYTKVNRCSIPVNHNITNMGY